MQSNTTTARAHSNPGKPADPGLIKPKDITMKTLSQLKAKLYANAAQAMKQNPAKADIIQKRTDSDAAHLSFAINMISIKL